MGYRIFIESETSGTIPRTEVRPTFSGEFTYKLETGKLYHVKELKEALKFTLKADYALFIAQKEVDKCENILITIEKLCGGEYVEEWAGYFKITNCRISYSYCWVRVKPDPNDQYACYEDIKDDEVNVYSALPVTEVTSLAGEYETRTCTQFFSGVFFDDYYEGIEDPDTSCLPDPDNWALKQLRTIVNGTEYTDSYPYTEEEPLELELIWEWHREVIDYPCDGLTPEAPPIGSGWQLAEDNCAVDGTAKWWREPVSNQEPVGPYLQGRTFSSIIDRALGQMNCSLEIKSDFFNINPVGDAPNNKAYTFAEDYLHNLTVHQKSDIKDKNSSNPSTFPSWVFTPEDFFNDLGYLFNAWFIIEDGTMILEHYSFFTSTVGADDSAIKMKLEIEFDPQLKRREKFFYADEKAFTEFLGTDIIYPCGKGNEEYRCRVFSCDLAYIENPFFNENISGEGFVLIATTPFEGNNVIIDNNLPLSWPELHENLHTYGRLFNMGTLNGVQQNFDSWKPYEIQEPYVKTQLCGEAFDPDELRTTPLGDGKVQEATKNIITCKIELKLAY